MESLILKYDVPESELSPSLSELWHSKILVELGLRSGQLWSSQDPVEYHPTRVMATTSCPVKSTSLFL